jgi:hypothetical protein
MDRLEFRKIKQIPGICMHRTSGSTGIAVEVQKYKAQQNNVNRHTELVNLWHNWDPKASTLKLNPLHGYKSGVYKQLISYPQMFPKDLTQFERIISYGETWIGIGIDLYSSEEFGYIAIQCPYDSGHLHIMDNLEIVFTKQGLRITDNDHPYLKDYEIGDYAESIVCKHIALPAMTHVKGRIRNMVKMPDGSSKWPMLGLYKFFEIQRYQVFQESLTKLRLHIIGNASKEVLCSMRKSLGYDFDIEIVQGNFKAGKFEEFICEV